MSRFSRILTWAGLLALLSLSLAFPAQAFTGKTGETVIIGKDEVITDDLYVAASEIVVDGTIQGDLIAAGSVITINGVVEGDVIAAAAEINLNGRVADDARLAAAAITLGEKASVGDDVVGAGASLETRPGSTIGGDLTMADAQNLLAGDVAGNAQLSTAALELRGKIDKNLSVNLGYQEQPQADQQETMPMVIFGGNGRQIHVPQVRPGITLAEGAQVGGDLDYTYNHEISVPQSAISGKVQRHEPVLDPEEAQRLREMNPSPAQRTLNFGLDILRHFIGIVVFGLAFMALLPAWFTNLEQVIRQKPLPSLGWGTVAWAAFFFALLLVILLIVLGGVVFGALTLGGLAGVVIWSGIFLLFGLILAFIVFSAFGVQVLFSHLGGQLLLQKLNPELAAHRVWPLLLGAFLFALLSAIPVLGGLIGFAALLAGLGALWLLVSAWWQARRAPAQA